MTTKGLNTQVYVLEFWHFDHERPYRTERIGANSKREAIGRARRLLGRRARRALSPEGNGVVRGWNLGDREGCDDAILVQFSASRLP